MSERSIAWTDNVGHGGPYSQDEWRLVHQALLGGDDGVLALQRNEYIVTINGSDLRAASGRALVNGTLAESDANVDQTPTVPAVGTTGLRLVLRKDWSARTITVELLQAADGTATPPSVTQSDGVTWEISLATAEITTGGTIQTLVDTREFVPHGGWEHLDTQALTATAASISFQNLSTAYKAFRLTLFISPTAPMDVYVRVNNDSGNNYELAWVGAPSATPASATAAGLAQWQLTNIADSVAAEPVTANLLIAKQLASLRGGISGTVGYTNDSTGTPNVEILAGNWSNVADLISRIDVIASTSTFAIGTRVTLEGMRAIP